MKKLTMLVLLLFMALFGILTASAQTGTFTATGYGLCQNTAVLLKPLYCTVTLAQNGTFQGYLTFYLVNNGTTTISSGQVWRAGTGGQQTGYAADVTGSIDTASSTVQFQFDNTLVGNATLGYRIQPGYCTRYCHPSRVVITTGIVTFQ